MNISELNPSRTTSIPQAMVLADPYTGEPLEGSDGNDVKFYVYGMQSDIARAAHKKRARHYGSNDDKMSDDEASRAGAELLAAITQGWTSNLEDDEGAVVFSYQRAVELYLEHDWIARQVMAFAGNVKNYDPKRRTGFGSGAGSSGGSTQSRKSSTKAESAKGKD